MANLIGQGILTAGTAAGVAAPSAALVTLPANCEIFLDVFNNHTTPASLAPAPTVVGTGGETWHLLDTLTTGAANPTNRLARYYTMVTANTATTVQMTFSGAQTQIAWSMQFNSGVKTAGVDGFGALGQHLTGANLAAATTLSITLSALLNPRNALRAAFLSSQGATAFTERLGWTELSDVSFTNSRYEEQAYAGPDSAASCTTASSLLAGIATELIAAAPQFNVASIVKLNYTAAGGGNPFGITLTAGRQYFVAVGHRSASFTGVTVAGSAVSCTQIYASVATANGYQTFLYQLGVPTIDTPVTIIVGSSGTASDCNVSIWEVSGFNPAIGGGSGIVQTQSTTSGTGAPLNISWGSPIGRDNPEVFFIWKGNDGGSQAGNGWQVGASPTGTTYAPLILWRGNGDPTPSAPTTGTPPIQGNFGFAIEFAAIPGPNAPTAAMVSPANGSSDPITQTFTLDVTDLDGDLTTVVITANGVNVYTGGSFQSGYSGSTSGITNGTRFQFTKTANWPSGPLAIVVTATDSAGHTSVTAFNFTIVASNPVITLQSPANHASIAQAATVTIDFTDADNDLDLTTIVVTANGDTVYTAGAFQTGYTAGSASALGTGRRLAIVKNSGWPVGGLGISCNVADAQGHTASATFGFTVTAPVTHSPVIALVSPPNATTIPKTSVLTVDITDQDDDLVFVAASISYPTAGTSENVYNGAFLGAFLAASVQTSIAHGIRLAIQRSGVFPDPSAIVLQVTAIDSGGRITSATFNWSLEAPVPTTAPTVAELEIEGRDIWFDVASENGADRIPTQAGDWRLVAGEEALRQSLLRRLITNPGDWTSKPDYGVGAPSYVKARRTAQTLDELRARIRAQYLRDPRVLRVKTVTAEDRSDGSLQISIDYISRNQAKRNTTRNLSVTLV